MSLSRRNFIKSVIAGGAVTSSVGYLFRSSGVLGQTSTAPGSVERLITLNVNGQMRRVDVLKQETLAMTLRYKLGLTGTKLGCDRAECGACSVLVDDVPHYSCSVLTHTVRGRNVVTIEGLAERNGQGLNTLHPLQHSFIDCGAVQCGYCIPGMLMAGAKLLDERPRPDLPAIQTALSGNICRCTGYRKIFDAVQAVGGRS